jgi:hypothetical protein
MLLRTLEGAGAEDAGAAAEDAGAAAEDAGAAAEDAGAGDMEGEEAALVDICTTLEGGADEEDGADGEDEVDGVDGEDGVDGADGADGRQLGSPTGIILGVAIGALRANVKTVVRLMAALSREMALMNVCGLLIAIVVRFKSSI